MRLGRIPGLEAVRIYSRQPKSNIYICTCGETGSTRYLEVVVLRRGGSNPLRCTKCLRSPTGSGSTFRAYSVWVRIPPQVPFTAGSSTVEQMSDTHLTEVRLFLGRPFIGLVFQSVEKQSHNLQVAGSSPAESTKLIRHSYVLKRCNFNDTNSNIKH